MNRMPYLAFWFWAFACGHVDADDDDASFVGVEGGGSTRKLGDPSAPRLEDDLPFEEDPYPYPMDPANADWGGGD